MNERLPRLTARKIIRILEGRGFVLVCSSGSHLISTGTRQVSELPSRHTAAKLSTRKSFKAF